MRQTRSGNPNLFSSRSESTSNLPAADRLRGNISRPLVAANFDDTRATPESGYLSPSAPNLVFSPFYFWVPFNVWHARSPVYNDPDDRAALTAPANDYSETYTNGEVGSAEINSLPEWIQASLRLMETKQSTGLPSDPVIRPLAMSESELQRRAQPINDALLALTDKKQLYQYLHDQFSVFQQNAQSLQAAQDSVASAQSDIAATTQRLATLGTHLTQKQAEVAKLQNDSRWCYWTRAITNYYCNQVASSQLLEIKTLNDQVEYNQEGLADLKRQADDAARSLTDLQGQRASLTANLSTFHVTVSAADQSANESQLMTINQQIQEQSDLLTPIQGFVVWDSSKTALIDGTANECPGNMYVYRFMGAVPPNHPLFTRTVEAELLPDKSASLVVCLDNQSKISSVHIVQDADQGSSEIYQSAVTRDSSGRIDSITVRGRDTPFMEQHSWLYQPDGSVFYGQKFVTDNDDMTAIRTQIPAP
jgi:hypothetical protein